ncbi:nuclear hormone receptor HR96-like isoform X1 [Amphibalanus amphitrite]|uniref:nuclear hormone receptor HR96-like isoform X1 n=2 Tax=Amphibalanus amphitrite TaxID=1232801 RepID=UPI001C906D83|nr:nuclear hormone receptor HR96-like isoform X1 [Amphibalanus amphitrite]
MDWMTGVLDRFYSATDIQQPHVTIKEEVMDSLELGGDLYCQPMGDTEETALSAGAPVPVSVPAPGPGMVSGLPEGPPHHNGAVPPSGEAPATPRPAKECGVCGDKALGYNFNAITCESCKAFFRRNALKTKVFRCPFQDNCSIDTVTRRFCQKCRLKKCYTIGMKKEWIMTDEERKVKRQKINENRSRKCDQTTNGGVAPAGGIGGGEGFTPNIKAEQGSPYSAETSPSGWLPHSPVSPYRYGLASPGGPTAAVGAAGAHEPPAEGQRRMVGEMSPLSLKHCGVQVPDSPPEPTSIDDGSISMSTILGKALRAEFSDTQLREPVLPTGALNRAERDKIDELFEAEQALMAPLNEDNMFVNLVNTDPSLINVINLCDIAIRRLIKMSKKISSFRSLCQRDQIALLKGGCTELMILRSVTTYDAENNSWNIRANETDYTSIKLNVLKKAPYDVYEEHKQFNRTFSHRWKTDPYIMGIISAITLFCPSRPNLEHVDAITLEQESYYYLLRRYLLTTMSPCEARSEFLKLIKKMEELHRLNEDHIKIFMDVDPLHVEPLLIEIFDLNPMRSFAPAPPVDMSDHQHQPQHQHQPPVHQPQAPPPPPPPL